MVVITSAHFQPEGLNSSSCLSLPQDRALRGRGGCHSGISWLVGTTVGARSCCCWCPSLGCDGGVCHPFASVTRPCLVSSGFWQHLCCWSVIRVVDVLFLPSQLVVLMRWERSWESKSSCSFHRPTATVRRGKAHWSLINGLFTVAGLKFKNCEDNTKLFWRCFLRCQDVNIACQCPIFSRWYLAPPVCS